MSKAELVSAAEFARRQKISSEMVRQAKEQGVFAGALVEVPGKKKPLIKYKLGVRYYESRLDPNFRKKEQIKRGQKNNQKGMKAAKRTSGKQKPKGKAKTDSTYVSYRAESEKYKALDKKFNLEIKQGLWIKKKEVQDKLFKVSRVCRDTLQNIPARTAALVAAKSKKDKKQIYEIIHKEVKTAIDDFLMELSKL